MEIALDRGQGRWEDPLAVQDDHHDAGEQQHDLVRVRPIEVLHRLRRRGGRVRRERGAVELIGLVDSLEVAPLGHGSFGDVRQGG